MRRCSGGREITLPASYVAEHVELYEWPEASTTTYYFNSFAEMHALCGSPWGCDPF